MSDAVIPHYQFALRILGSSNSSANQGDEFQVVEKIKRHLVRRGRDEDAATFAEMHRKLQSQGILRNRWAVLQLFMSLSGTGHNTVKVCLIISLTECDFGQKDCVLKNRPSVIWTEGLCPQEQTECDFGQKDCVLKNRPKGLCPQEQTKYDFGQKDCVLKNRPSVILDKGLCPQEQTKRDFGQKDCVLKNRPKYSAFSQVDVLPLSDSVFSQVNPLPLSDSAFSQVDVLPLSDSAFSQVDVLPLSDSVFSQVDVLPLSDSAFSQVDVLPLSDSAFSQVDVLPLSDSVFSQVDTLPLSVSVFSQVDTLSLSDSAFSQQMISSSLFNSQPLPSHHHHHTTTTTSTPVSLPSQPTERDTERVTGRPALDTAVGLPGLTQGAPSSLQSQHTTLSSGISSIRCDGASDGPTPVPQSFFPSSYTTPYTAPHTPWHGDPARKSPDAFNKNAVLSAREHQTSLVLRNSRTVTSHRGDNTSSEIPEAELVKDVIYAFQGIEGKWIKLDSGRDGYRIDSQAGIPKAVRHIISKLAECGWLYNKIRTYVESRSADKAFGLIGQSFCAALHQELTEYYRLIAVLEAQLQQEQDQGISEGDGLTLKRLVVWTFDPLLRLKTLAALVDACKGKKGGALASSIFSYTQHGDPYIKALIKHTLTLVSQPIYSTLMRWIYDGELEDTYHEFFVASDPTVKNDRLWHDKYSLRKSMIPSFLSIDQARRISLTGKSINFLRQVCQDRTPIMGRDAAMSVDSKHAQSMFVQDEEASFQTMIDGVYTDTSRHLLDVLHSKYKFMDHLKAMRRYLLLGQGDFIRHLMDLLEEDLAKPAGNLYLHNLNGILETAIRATNAQYDDADILKRLDVRLLEVSPGDTGWDVFSLDYHVDGPIRTVFTPECMIMYLRVFNFLWRAKRMEYILAVIWKNQVSNARTLIPIPELASILHQCQMLGCEMQHFIQQVQYYINFEVLECSWDELLHKVQEAADLDHIIAAHQVFLDTVLCRCLLDEKSREILTQLRTIFDLIIQFQTAQDSFYQAAGEELEARNHFAFQREARTRQGEWALTEEEEGAERDRRATFLRSIIPSTRAQMTVLAQSYQDMVQRFLVMVTSHPDVSLRFLSFRLDFNQHYKVKEPNTRSPLNLHRTRSRPIFLDFIQHYNVKEPSTRSLLNLRRTRTHVTPAPHPALLPQESGDIFQFRGDVKSMWTYLLTPHCLGTRPHTSAVVVCSQPHPLYVSKSEEEEEEPPSREKVTLRCLSSQSPPPDWSTCGTHLATAAPLSTLELRPLPCCFFLLSRRRRLSNDLAYQQREGGATA
ncbi:gamma-tubulin complex component 3 homolog [Babylonia areolata]|uniref:gamma-tubulin complex component 3 homolog n=1 Tax=Babylonia areolata TaxID=304850 RepID=UPI003FD0E06F